MMNIKGSCAGTGGKLRKDKTSEKFAIEKAEKLQNKLPKNMTKPNTVLSDGVALDFVLMSEHLAPVDVPPFREAALQLCGDSVNS